MGNCHYRGAKCVQRRADLWVEREWQVIGKPLNLAAAGLGGSQAGLTGSSSYHHVNGKRARATNPSSSNAAGTTGISISVAGSGEPALADADGPVGVVCGNIGVVGAANQLGNPPLGATVPALDHPDAPLRATGLGTAARAVVVVAVEGRSAPNAGSRSAGEAPDPAFNARAEPVAAEVSAIGVGCLVTGNSESGDNTAGSDDEDTGVAAAAVRSTIGCITGWASSITEGNGGSTGAAWSTTG